jgi:hypothetical protein
MSRRAKIALGGIVASAILLSLAVINGFWAFLSGLRGPLIASLLYFIVFILCFFKRHFKAGLIAAAFGFGIHLAELFLQGISELEDIQKLFFVMNLILPLPLALMSYLASSES